MQMKKEAQWGIHLFLYGVISPIGMGNVSSFPANSTAHMDGYRRRPSLHSISPHGRLTELLRFFGPSPSLRDQLILGVNTLQQSDSRQRPRQETVGSVI